MPQQIDTMVFVGFNSRVAALDTATGNILWDWEAPKSKGGYVTLHLLGDRQLIAAVDGYIYCLDPRTGTETWMNETKGFGTGVTSMTSVHGRTRHDSLVAAAAEKAAAAAAAAAAAT